MKEKERTESERAESGKEREKERQYEYWLANMEGLSNRKKCALRKGAASAEEVYYIEETGYGKYSFLSERDVAAILESKKKWNLEKEYRRAAVKNIRFIPFASEEYPRKLLEIKDYPYALYVKGRLPREECLTVAVVGARQCSAYGRAMAREFAAALSGAGVQIISGMANGIDGISQKSALEAGGDSYAVLGSGVDICYPRENISLYMELLEKGGVISEVPIGKSPKPYYFPMRNRIISGLSDVVVVIEAKEKSGSLITADQALEQGRDVYALPGPVTSALSRGCNRLIRQGAGILLSPEDFMEELQINCVKKMKKLPENKIMLESKEELVYSHLAFYPKNMDEIVREVRLPVAEVMNILVSLELQGYSSEISKNHYIRLK